MKKEKHKSSIFMKSKKKKKKRRYLKTYVTLYVILSKESDVRKAFDNVSIYYTFT